MGVLYPVFQAGPNRLIGEEEFFAVFATQSVAKTAWIVINSVFLGCAAAAHPKNTHKIEGE